MTVASYTGDSRPRDRSCSGRRGRQRVGGGLGPLLGGHCGGDGVDGGVGIGGCG